MTCGSGSPFTPSTIERPHHRVHRPHRPFRRTRLTLHPPDCHPARGRSRTGPDPGVARQHMWVRRARLARHVRHAWAGRPTAHRPGSRDGRSGRSSRRRRALGFQRRAPDRRHAGGVPLLLQLPHLPQLPGRPAQRLPEPHDGDARPRRRTALLRGRLWRLLPAARGRRDLHRAGQRQRRDRRRRQLCSVTGHVRARARRHGARGACRGPGGGGTRALRHRRGQGARCRAGHRHRRRARTTGIGRRVRRGHGDRPQRGRCASGARQGGPQAHRRSRRRRGRRGRRTPGCHRRRSADARPVRPLRRDRQHQRRTDLRLRSVPVRLLEQDHGRGVALRPGGPVAGPDIPRTPSASAAAASTRRGVLLARRHQRRVFRRGREARRSRQHRPPPTEG